MRDDHAWLLEGTFVIEQAPVHDWSGKDRGVVAEGAVGTLWAGRFRISATRSVSGAAATSPTSRRAWTARGHRPMTNRARRVLDVVREVPTPVWGRDELATGEMWNSNSVIAWTLARSGIDTEAIQPPAGGRGAWLASRTRGCAQTRQSGKRDRRAFAPALSESIDG